MSRQPVTIMYLITGLDIGGAERNLYELARRLDRTRYRPLVAALQGSGPISKWLTDAGIPVHDLNLCCPCDVACFFRLVRLMRAERVDILHTFLFHANLVGRLAAPLARVPVVISSVRVAERERPWHVWLDGATSCLVDVETCVSDSVRHFTHARSGVPMRKLLTIPNGVDLSRFTLTRSEARSRLSLPADAPLILFVGRMVHQKAVDLIPRIVLRVRASVPNVRFLLAGAGPLESFVRDECHRLGVSDSVELLGRRDDVPVLLSAADVFMLPSRYEGLANVVLEAQAARTPVVVTDVEGTRELVESGVTGIVVPPSRPDLFADAIVSLLHDPARRHSISDLARERVGRSLTLERMVFTNCDLYEELLSRHAPRGCSKLPH